ncbi:MAG: hypothetical protein P0Y64_04000 [Candidatus Sphingomonas colombiensis]|nr:hypothetical protein [Sphingomonas sp.]WEK44002.1 MAG: hypothetical protein P0Y64_04000 [Sphingomonas sp.]
MFTAEFRPIATALINTGLFNRPPAYSRLEPQSVTGDPTAGVAAALHDPLWSMLRQWQVGEFAGEDAGTPLAVTIGTSSTPITLFAPGAPGGGAMAGQPIGSRATLDRLIEAEPPATPGAGSRQRAEASATLIAALAEAGLDVATVLPGRYPFGAGATGDLPRPALAVMLRAGADAEPIAADLEAGTPDWLAPGSAAAKAAAQEWLGWYRAGVSPTASGACWDAKRLEYHFSVATDAGRGQKVFTAPMHLGGDIDWHALDLVPGASMSANGDPTFPLTPHDPPAGDGTPPTTLVAPLRFAGMAADRFWEFEDGRVNFGSMSVQINDPARLCLIEFATVYGCDWFLAPVEVSASAFTTVTSLSVVDSFGVTTTIERAGTGSPGARFCLFEPSVAGSTETARGLLTIGGARGALEGPPREMVVFLRDETANMVWAIETNVEDASGLVRSRQDELRAIPDYPPPDPRAELRYTLETEVPRHWIPMVPVPMAGATNGFILRKGTMTDADDSRGRILAGKPRELFDPEVPRGGIRVSRTPTLARDAAGRPIRWTALRSGEGFGELTSGFASDSAEKITTG